MTRPGRGELFAALERGVRELVDSPQWQRYLSYQSRFHRYSPNNVLLIAAQCPQASEVASFSTWRRQGRFVRRGERAVWILAPVLERGAGADGEERLCGFRPVPVFDVSQTDGDEPPRVCAPLTGADGGDHFAALAALAAARGFTVIDHDFAGAAHGDCDHRTRTLRIERANPQSQRVKTLAHELAHAVLHERVDSRAEAELEAESVAYVVCRSLGVDSGGYSFGYLTAWAGGGEEAVVALRRSAMRIQNTASAIITALEAGPPSDAGLRPQLGAPSSRCTVAGEKAGTHTDT